MISCALMRYPSLLTAVPVLRCERHMQIYFLVSNKKYQICLGMCFLLKLPIVYVTGTRIKPWTGFDRGRHVRSIMSRGRGFDTLNENPLSEIFALKTIRLRRLTVPGTVLKPPLSIIPDLDRLCNNPWKESLIVWGYIYVWYLWHKKLKQVGENAAWKYKSWPAHNSSRTGLVMQDGHRIRCLG